MKLAMLTGGRKRGELTLLFLGLLIGCCCLALISATILRAGEAVTDRPFRMACSMDVFSDVNESDIQAVMKVWIKTVSRDRNFAMDPDPHIMPSPEALLDFGKQQPIDAFLVLTPEIVKLQQSIPFDLFVVPLTGGSSTEEYIILVNKNSGIKNIAQLKNAELNVWDNSRMSLAAMWLDSVVMERDLGCMPEFFKRIIKIKKPGQAALPVFFGKVKACLMTKSSFQIMSELNPQIARQLEVIASSSPIVTYGFALRSDVNSQYRQDIISAVENFTSLTIGKQVMTYIQADSMKVYPISILDGSLALLRKHELLSREKKCRLSSRNKVFPPASIGTRGG